MENIRIGIGYDIHPFERGRDLFIGGEKIDYPLGLKGHSDADVLIHAIIDSLLGAADLGNIGILFPDSDKRYSDIKSTGLLKEVAGMLQKRNIQIINIDTVVICDKPRINDYILKMKQNIGKALNGLPVSRIGIKGKTGNGLGAIGAGKGIAAHAVSLLLLPQADPA